jgi:hypothetical protein
VRADDDQRGPVLHALGVLGGALERLDREVLAHVLHVPAVGLEAHPHVLAEVTVDWARQLDVVVVEEDDQLPEPEVPGERAHLGAHALLDVSVARDHVGVVVDQLVAEAGGEHPLCERHADRHGQSLAERPCGRLDARRLAVLVLRVPGGRATELAEVLQVVE